MKTVTYEQYKLYTIMYRVTIIKAADNVALVKLEK